MRPGETVQISLENTMTGLMHPELLESVAAFLTQEHKLFIGNEWRSATGKERIAVEDPATGTKISDISAGGAADIDLAVAAARKAFDCGDWAKLKPLERTALMNKLADLIDNNIEELAQIESLDGGNPLQSVKQIDIPLAVSGLRSMAGWTDKVSGNTPLARPQGDGLSYVLRQPVGVAGIITPWNAPFLMVINKIAPALAAGCTCVVKPAELAPLTALKIAELSKAAGFPAGVINVVTGYGHVAGQALVNHPDVNKISFTGSTEVGKGILRSAAETMKRVTLELGGKSPIIVFADADLEKASASIAREICFKAGQFCAAGTRLYIEKAIEKDFVLAMTDRLGAVRSGHGLDPKTQMGPVISEKQLNRISGLVEKAVAEGSQIICGGARAVGGGHFMQPTLLKAVSHDAEIMEEEIFGPVLCYATFDGGEDLEPVIALANNSRYGLSSKVWTMNVRTMHEMAKRLEAGQVVVNGGGGDVRLPFGGFKESGIGRENGLEGVLSYTEVKGVSIGY